MLSATLVLLVLEPHLGARDVEVMGESIIPAVSQKPEQSLEHSQYLVHILDLSDDLVVRFGPLCRTEKM